ncbi:hypothetical protein D9758_006761 [Tetrapyrgos nigripes]|uniref:Arrestin-like N-terminal domain-containing protein n=1 Tax=Tetrapyrgos nigripes TaxID=182062 RepID=A0A8H5CVH5_9AGAR|nr:hypothetical protein D9758_006761 [Tetrapyrgos nigripes]
MAIPSSLPSSTVPLMPADKPLKNSLNIRLAESAVFLRTNDTSGRNRYNDSRPTMLRGLLTLELVKATRISSIQLELQAKSATAWPEGTEAATAAWVGAHRTDVTEVHKVFSSTQAVFKATPSRRAASLDASALYAGEDDFDPHQGLDLPLTSRTARRASGDWFRRAPSVRSDETSIIDIPTPPYTPSISSTSPHTPSFPSPPPSAYAPSIISVASTYDRPGHAPQPPPSPFGLDSVNENAVYEEARIGWRDDLQRDHTRRSGPLVHRRNSATSSHHSIRSASRRRPSVGDVPEQLEAESLVEGGPPPFLSADQNSFASTSNVSQPSPSEFRRGDPPFLSSPTTESLYGSISNASTSQASRSPSVPRGRKKRRFSLASVSNLLKDVVRLPSRSSRSSRRATDEEPKDRRRSSSRFSFRRRNTEKDDEDAITPTRGRSRKGKGKASTVVNSPTAVPNGNTDDSSNMNESRSILGANLTRIPTQPDAVSLNSGRTTSPGPAPSVQFKTKDGRTSKSSFRLSGEIAKKNEGDGWKEFKKGVYTYPVCFQIPGHAPPSLESTYGSVTWRLKASVHRPGAFSSKMTTQRDVLVLSCPSEEDTEDTENIIVERHWDGQLHFTMLPLAKVKIHRISVVLEEKVEYHNNFKSVGRTDPISTAQLLSLREEGKSKDVRHILPLESDDTNALINSPLYQVLDLPSDPHVRDQALTEMAADLMGPGPWTFHQELQLPASCKILHATNKNRRSNISITHLLKCVMRVERGDDSAIDERTGKRKLFDIVVQTPVMILACRCNPEWTSVPTYSERLEDPTSIAPQCPCVTRQLSLEREHEANSSSNPKVKSAESVQILPVPSHLPTPAPISLNDNGDSINCVVHGNGTENNERLSSDSSRASNAETSPLNQNMQSLRNCDNLLLRNTLFERLVSGQESEMGEAPPAYEVIEVLRPSVIKVGGDYQTATFISAVQ